MSVPTIYDDASIGSLRVADKRNYYRHAILPHWTVERYQAALANGTFAEDDPVELVDGIITLKMPTGRPHRRCQIKLTDYFVLRHHQRFGCSVQSSLTLLPDSEPEPDIALVAKMAVAEDRDPDPRTEVPLIIEIADSSLDYDREDKSRLYARHGLPEYWIINLRDAIVEVHAKPSTDTGRYQSMNSYGAGEHFDSKFNGLTEVDDLLP